ncbi:peptide ABC transporter substrate-binding protein [Zhihengliuella halotolerans]|uniref:Oligopeptide transport system substrate-binding protein n=1 Tax=Zhihengliuella halotolerans TaxID=370736 RepID=A0A4Q8ACK5_9MICC|nr:ABC transporter substrate-binding protein [Zhihengliuella halotolerans]RZU61940.1 oligopeptide transport system substrate-binding protein [Zhihengliuella halotolerans]
MRMNRVLKGVAVTSALALALTACGGSGDGGGAAADGVVTAHNTEPENGLIPTSTSEVGGGRVVDLIYAGLYSYAQDGSLQEELAESVESEDNVTWTVKLKEGQTFSDGSPVTASSFVDAWNYGADSDNAQKASYFFNTIKGFKDSDEEGADELSGLTVVDETTFTVELMGPESDFPLRLGYSAYKPLPEVAFEDMAAFGEQPVTNGPYILAEDGWQHNVEMELVPNEDYEGPRAPKNNGITFTIYENYESGYQDLVSGHLDVMDQMPPNALDTYEDDLEGRASSRAYAGNANMVIPGYLKEFEGEPGKLRRQAISMAIDRQAIIDTVFKGTKEVAKEFTAPVLDGYSEDIPGSEVLEYDPKKAKELWDEADAISPWPEGKVLKYTSNVDGAGNREYIEAITNQLRNNLEIEAELDAISTFQEMRQIVSEDGLEGISRAGWQADYPSLYNFLGPLFGTGASSNDGRYSSEEFDAKLQEGLQADSVEEGAQFFNEAQEILFEDLPALPLWYQANQAGWSADVTNVEQGWDGVPLYYNIETVE